MDTERLSAVFKVMGHPVRLQILAMLRQGEICVCQIESTLGKRQAYISQQLMELREAGIVEARKEGLQVFYHITEPLVLCVLDSIFSPTTFIPLENLSSNQESVAC